MINNVHVGGIVADYLTGYYLWIKALHIIFVMSWMAGMLYLPRLYVYHAQSKPGSELSETLKIMERRLLRGIINPAMIASFIFGGLLLMVPGVLVSPLGWLHVKLLFVLLLSAYHGFLARWRKDFERDQNQRSHTFYRMINEIPAVFMIIIVIMVVIKPF